MLLDPAGSKIPGLNADVLVLVGHTRVHLHTPKGTHCTRYPLHTECAFVPTWVQRLFANFSAGFLATCTSSVHCPGAIACHYHPPFGADTFPVKFV
eukprot:2446958-Rhodomonas_salina.2